MPDLYADEERAAFNTKLDQLIELLQAARAEVVAARQCPAYRLAQARVSRVLLALGAYLDACSPAPVQTQTPEDTVVGPGEPVARPRETRAQPALPARTTRSARSLDDGLEARQDLV
jgi:hypothetical protein